MALGTEMLSLLAMVIAGDWWWGALAGKTVIAASPRCARLALFAAGRRFFRPAAGVVAALVYISIPWVSHLPRGVGRRGLGVLFVPGGVCAAAVPAGQAGNHGCVHAPFGYVILAGYLAGAAVATKYPAVLFVLLPLAVWGFFGRLGATPAVRVRGSGVRTGNPPRFDDLEP